MKLLHNDLDKNSRDFLEKYRNEFEEILNYPECLEKYPYISAFPSIVFNIPARYVPQQKFDGIYDEENNEVFAPIIIPEHNENEYYHLVRWDDPNEDFNVDGLWKLVKQQIAEIEEIKEKYPPKDGVIYK